ncbi:Paired amphipathic helix protein Sin3a [Blastocladiella emersonii ATCC 22665]|nr:Paired amphipathic helix protein Sin3a [Blastocladiella emersonii ATCC 22665]
MNGYKAGKIDQATVMSQIAAALHGCPKLILRFNLFLPPGFSMETTGNPERPVKLIAPKGGENPIDIPTTMSRIANVFHGSPDLILGFNTFRPPGHSIELNGNAVLFPVNVTAPNGVETPPARPVATGSAVVA